MRDLKPYYDREFITQAFRGVLGREPDEEGIRHYLRLLERGWYRVEVVGRMRYSAEGRKVRARIAGLLPALAVRLVFRIPVLGYLLELLVVVLRLPRRLRELERFQHSAMGGVERLRQDVAAFRVALERAPQSVPDPRLNADWRPAARTARSTPGSNGRGAAESVDLSLLKADWHRQLSELEARLTGSLREQAQLMQSVRPGGLGWPGGANKRAAALELRLTNKIQELESRQARTLLERMDRVSEMESKLLTWQGEWQTKAAAQESRQARQFAGLLNEVNDAMNTVTNRGAVSGALAELEQRMREENERTRQIEVRTDHLEVRAGEIAEQLSSLGSRFMEELADTANHVTVTSERLNERGAFLENEFGGLAQEVSTFQSHLNHLQVTFGNQIDDALNAVTRLRRDVILQERRSGLLLEEARKRMPGPLTPEQLAVFNEEGQRLLDAMYVSFEDEFRGTREDIKQRLEVYLPLLRDAGLGGQGREILDVGCGRGEWLEVLRDNGLVAKGVDNNRIMVESCRNLGLEITESDVLEYLRSLPDESLGAVTGFHIIEHLPFEVLVALFDECLRVLVTGGLMIFETPNPGNLQVAAYNFYFDPSHRNPLPSPMVAYTAEARGFTRVRVMELHPFPEFETAQLEQTGFQARLRQLLLGPQDYSVIGYKP